MKMFRKKYITKLEDENQYLKLVNEDLEGELNDKKNAILSVYRLIIRSKSEKIYGEAGYRRIFRQIEEIVEKNTEKKLSDEIFTHFTNS
jgi:hypothetical protein